MTEHQMVLEGKRVLILTGEIYEDLELWYPKLRLEEAGAEVVVAGPEADTHYSGKHGYPCVSDAAIDQMLASVRLSRRNIELYKDLAERYVKLESPAQAERAIVPFVVVSAIRLPATASAVNSRGEFPRAKSTLPV